MLDLGGLSNMTDNERELINIIRDYENPKYAAEMALNLLIDFLAKREEPQDTSSVHLRVSV